MAMPGASQPGMPVIANYSQILWVSQILSSFQVRAQISFATEGPAFEPSNVIVVKPKAGPIVVD